MNAWSPPTKIDPSDIAPLRIAGFGACMITGFPHKGGGLFEVACALVEKETSRPVEPNILTLHSFPAPRAGKYLKSRVVPFNPDYVVFQFGSTDAARPVRAKRSSIGAISKGRTAYHPPNAFTIARWHMQSLVGFVWKAAPITSLSSYVTAIEHMVNDCISAEITPVVLSPFIFGSLHSLKNAADYANALRDLNSRVARMIFIDCIHLLSKAPKSKVLLNDGFHLSRLAHNLIGEAIGQAIVSDVRTKSGVSETRVASMD
jgi:lysophospholipase L1-like esterase